jgi:hypothetical protein
MMKEINLFDIYIAPFAGYMALALVVFWPVRRYFDRIQIQNYVWHRALFDMAVYVIILSVIGLIF